MSEEKKSFEERLSRLDQIVAKVEGETLPLDEAMKLFEEGKKLIDSLQSELKEAEEKIAKSLKGNSEN
ncbi:MAG: exodeoxyribonuclease VII small subunit [Bacilli bacterium]|nr:exodeoxyribonuclease VII small subunit [Bacilli bacterium]MBO6286524.1 exodeoxyribonuclease VII small subunit [Bacilli bacterium]